MTIMTEEEADTLDELLTRTTPKVNPEDGHFVSLIGIYCWLQYLCLF